MNIIKIAVFFLVNSLVLAGDPYVDLLESQDVSKEMQTKRDADWKAKGLVVHEWGTVNLVQGDKGVVIGGLVEDQSDLPPYVEVWTKQPSQPFPMIIEKPILYFYTKTKEKVSVQVTCPRGMFTQWWPPVQKFEPQRHSGRQVAKAENGSLHWNHITLHPKQMRELNEVPENSWWPMARDVDAAYLNVRGADERFLFYRGVADMDPPITGELQGDQLVLKNHRIEGSAALENIFVVRVNGEHAAHSLVPSLESGAEQAVTLGPLVEGGKKALSESARRAFQGIVETQGLYPKEALGMSTIWQGSYFETDGLRIIYTLPEKDVDAFMPLRVRPAPVDQVRVLGMRLEVMTAERRSEIITLIQQLGHEEIVMRNAAEKVLRTMNRFAYAVMREQYEKTGDPEIKVRLRRIVRAMPTLKVIEQ